EPAVLRGQPDHPLREAMELHARLPVLGQLRGRGLAGLGHLLRRLLRLHFGSSSSPFGGANFRVDLQNSFVGPATYSEFGEFYGRIVLSVSPRRLRARPHRQGRVGAGDTERTI